MEVNAAVLDKLAQLANLEIPEDKKPALAKDLEKMIAFMDQLNQLDTTGISPLLHVTDATDRVRIDAVRNQLSQAEALAPAAEHATEFFTVPKVIG